MQPIPFLLTGSADIVCMDIAGLLAGFGPSMSPTNHKHAIANCEIRPCFCGIAYFVETEYFHCVQNGHRIDNIDNNPKVSFCAVGYTEVLPSKFSTNYVSAVAFGTASELQGTERYDALRLLLEKYSSDFMEEGKKYIKKLDKVTKVIKIEIQHISGKKAPIKS